MHGDSMEQELINQLLALPGETIHLEKGEFLFHEGDIADHFFIVREGRLSIKKFEVSGHIFAHRLVGPNNVLVESPLSGTRTSGLTCSMRLHVKNARYIPSVMMFWNQPLQRTIHWPLQ